MPRRSLTEDLDAIATLREPTRRALYEYVRRQAAPVSRDEAARHVGVARPLAAFHLDRLVDVGLLKAEYRRLSGRTGPGAGRPSKLYRPSRRPIRISVPRRNHELLARILAASASERGDRAPLERARRVGHALGARARRRLRGGAVRSRLDCVERVLEYLGFEPLRIAPGELKLRNCPFDPLARRYTPVVCGVGQAVVAGLVAGMQATRLQVSRDEHPGRCCVVLRSAPQAPAR